MQRVADPDSSCRITLRTRVRNQVLEVPARVLDVMGSDRAQAGNLFVGERAHYLPGRAQHERPIGNALSLRDEGVGPDQAFATDDGVVEDKRLDADQRSISNRAAVQHRLVPDTDL